MVVRGLIMYNASIPELVASMMPPLSEGQAIELSPEALLLSNRVRNQL